ncbi:MAG: hypothetical protein DBY37_12045 [Desulfovibrionaceae bacterium]|nr:MAG: hypothetical protein DBY37_12045 [Desulfovibrionaceae bacterium]
MRDVQFYSGTDGCAYCRPASAESAPPAGPTAENPVQPVAGINMLLNIFMFNNAPGKASGVERSEARTERETAGQNTVSRPTDAFNGRISGAFCI